MNSIDFVVLGELKEKPQYAGEIITSLKQKNLHNTMNFTLSSIYRKVIELKDKGYIKAERLSIFKSQDTRVYHITHKGEEYFNNLIKLTISSDKNIDAKLNINETVAIFEYTNKEKQISYIRNLKENIIETKQELYKDKEIKSKAEKIVFLQKEKILIALEEWVTEIEDELLIDKVENGEK